MNICNQTFPPFEHVNKLFICVGLASGSKQHFSICLVRTNWRLKRWLVCCSVICKFNFLIVFMLISRCRAPKDVSHHGSPVFSPARHLQQFHWSRSSCNSFCQAIQKFNSPASSSSSALQPSSRAITHHLLASHYMAKKLNCLRLITFIISLLAPPRFKTCSLLTFFIQDIFSILL